MKHIFRKIISGVILAAVVSMSLSALVSAETITSEDSKVKIETPNEKWKVVDEAGIKLAVSDGTDKVLIQEYQKEEPIPDPLVQAAPFAEIYQTYYTIADKVYCITGLSMTADGTANVRAIVESFQISE